MGGVEHGHDPADVTEGCGTGTGAGAGGDELCAGLELPVGCAGVGPDRECAALEELATTGDRAGGRDVPEPTRAEPGADTPATTCGAITVRVGRGAGAAAGTVTVA
jgi:hypothetical protein